jgi:hypothetical protein
MSLVTDEEANFKRDLFRFRSDYSIIRYLEMRQKYPNRRIPIDRLADLESIPVLEQELKDFGIDHNLLLGVLDADPVAIDTVCMIALLGLDESDVLKQEGRTQIQSRGLAPKYSTLHVLVCIIFEVMQAKKIPMDYSSLLLLTQKLLLSGITDFEKARSRRDLRRFAIISAAGLLQEGKNPSMRKVAKSLGVNVSSISRLFKRPDQLVTEAEELNAGISSSRGKVID